VVHPVGLPVLAVINGPIQWQEWLTPQARWPVPYTILGRMGNAQFRGIKSRKTKTPGESPAAALKG